MSGIDPANLPNRSASGPDAGVTKVARSEALHDGTTTPRPAAPSWQSPVYSGSDPSAGRRGHNEPAVSLSASLARLALGATIKATVIGFDNARQPVIKTDQGTFILDAGDIHPPLDLKINTQLELRVIAVDHMIEAQLISKNNVSLSPPPLLNLTLVGVEESVVIQSDPAVIRTAATAGQTAAPVLYTPQPAQTAMMSDLAKLPPMPLAPTSFLTLREQDNPAATQTIPASGLALPPHESSGSGEPLVPPLLAQPAGQPAAPTASGDPFFLSELGEVLKPLAAPSGDPAAARPAPLAGLVLNATLVSAEAAKPGDTAAPRLTLGQSLLVRIVDAVAAGTTEHPGAPALLPAGQPGPSQAAYPLAAAPPQALTWRTGGQVIAVETAGPPPAAEDPARNAATTETASAPATQSALKTLLIATPAGVIRVEAPGELPLGSHVIIDVKQAFAPETTATALPPAATPARLPQAPLPLASFLDKWPALDKILTILSNLSPSLAASLQARIAAPFANLGGAVQLFAKALDPGSGAEQWLGRGVVDTLVRSGNQALIDALKSDLGRIAQSAANNAPDDWKTILLPIHDGRQIQALPVLIRSFEGEPRQNDKSDGEGKTAEKSGRVVRFVVDVALSRMGQVQMDGMIKAKSFTLIMRTEQPLGHNMHNQIRGIFGAALARNRFEGDLVFRTGKPYPLTATAFLDGAGNAAGGAQGNAPENMYV